MRRYPVPLEPPFWARGGHAQTILGHVLPTPGRALGPDQGDTRFEVALADGDTLVGYRCQRDPASSPWHAPDGRPVRAHLFHGLSGDANADYIRLAAAALNALGAEVWAFNHRGAGQGAGLARGIYHSGRYDDVAAVLAASRAEAPDQLQLVVGFSLSGNASLRLAAEWEHPSQPDLEWNGLAQPPDAILALNPPIDLEDCSRRIQSGLNRLYQARFVRRLRRVLAERKRAFADFPPLSVPRGATLWDFDERVTAPLGGFTDARDYYATCSTVERLDQIQVPTAILMTGDDPFVGAERLSEAPRSESVHIHIEETGGHVGYLTKSGPLGYRAWLEGAIAHYAIELVQTASPETEPARSPSGSFTRNQTRSVGATSAGTPMESSAADGEPTGKSRTNESNSGKSR